MNVNIIIFKFFRHFKLSCQRSIGWPVITCGLYEELLATGDSQDGQAISAVTRGEYLMRERLEEKTNPTGTCFERHFAPHPAPLLVESP